MSPARAGLGEVPADFAHEVLADPTPMVFAPFTVKESDFSAEWQSDSTGSTGASLGLEAELVSNSVQWVRVAQYLLAPRARIRITAPEGSSPWESISVRGAGAVENSGAGSVLEFPAALAARESSTLEVSVRRAGKVRKHRLYLAYRGKPGAYVDPSCSAFIPELSGIEGLGAGQWAYLGCRTVRTRQGLSDIPAVELFLHWVGAKGPIRINGMEADPSSPGVWVNRMGPRHSRFEFSDASGSRFTASFYIPPKLSYASLGLGIGPYGFHYSDPGKTVSKIHPIATVYGSYFLTDSSRMVAFDAYAPGSSWFNDLGIYFSNESSRTLDDRLTVNIFLGFHVIGFRADSGVAYRLGVPQGFEMTFKDAFVRRYNASLGGFFYPPIAGKSYYNAWVRYGKAGMFAELNYFAWSELGPAQEQVYSRSLGVCVGAPLIYLK